MPERGCDNLEVSSVPTTPKGWRCVIFFKLREEDWGDKSDGALTLAVVEDAAVFLVSPAGANFNVVVTSDK
jgi:hypothetical protein